MSAIPSSFNKINQQSVQYNKPVSESSLSALGSSVNGLLDVLQPVGTIMHSVLTEAQFNSEVAAGYWLLCNGQSCAGSSYEGITGNANVPDFGGYFLRMANTAGSPLNPDNTALLGTQAGQNADHTHAASVTDPTHTHTANVTDPTHTHGNSSNIYFRQNSGTGPIDHNATYNPGDSYTSLGLINAASTGITVANVAAATGISVSNATSGGNETRPVAATVNMFLRIN